MNGKFNSKIKGWDQINTIPLWRGCLKCQNQTITLRPDNQLKWLIYTGPNLWDAYNYFFIITRIGSVNCMGTWWVYITLFITKHLLYEIIKINDFYQSWYL